MSAHQGVQNRIPISIEVLIECHSVKTPDPDE
jgi:hypothetical protein